MDSNNKQIITEGQATVKTEGNVFYNPVQEFNRDLRYKHEYTYFDLSTNAFYISVSPYVVFLLKNLIQIS